MFNTRLTDLIDHDIVDVNAFTNPDVGLTFKATGHLIPQVDLALTAFGLVKSSVFVELDASVDFTIATSTAHDAQACASANTTLDVGVGAQGSLFGILGASVRKSLFNESFPLLQVRVTASFSSFALNDNHDRRTNALGRPTRTGILRLVPLLRAHRPTSPVPQPRSPTQLPVGVALTKHPTGHLAGLLFLRTPGTSNWSVH
jgi:hypothetical protein